MQLIKYNLIMKTKTLVSECYSAPKMEILEIESEGVFCASNGAGEDLDPNPDEIG